jgi:serine/threonine protein kinase
MKLRTTHYERAGVSGQPCQDRLAVERLDDDGLLCVLSDGVGTARDPERCAERVVRLIADNFAARPGQWSTRKSLEHLVQQANESLEREGFFLDGTTSMQATLAVTCLKGGRLFGLNVGDSPVLLVRRGETQRLSQNHVRRGTDGQERMTQCVGMGRLLQPHYFESDLAENDAIVLTSDGLTKLMDDQALGVLATKCATARHVMETAIGGRDSEELDDMSLVVVRVEDVGDLEPETKPAPTASFPHPAKGQDFEGYLLLNRIAGNDRVWLARKEGRRYVLKFVPQEAQTDDSGAIFARFARESRNACRLHGDFFVPAKRPESGNPYYYVMEYVEAPSVGFLLKTRKLSADEALELGKFLCRAGQFLLRHELVHGDLKPENILVLKQGDQVSFQLLDLGLADTIFSAASNSGTPSYLAPERFKGAPLTERTEIFSIGATLYESMTGHKPFGAIERFQTPHHPAPVRMTRWNPNVPPWLECVIFKCISVKADHRYQHYSEVLFGLNHPEDSPWNVHHGPLLERNPLLFYRAGFWLLLALTMLLTLLILCRP